MTALLASMGNYTAGTRTPAEQKAWRDLVEHQYFLNQITTMQQSIVPWEIRRLPTWYERAWNWLRGKRAD